jgi:tetratricopeptide (TPR) repeat protein
VTRILKVFLSSPGDVAEERALAVRVFERLAREFAEVANLELVLWEHEPLFAHTYFQDQIARPSQCDLVVTILWSRLGSRLPSRYAAVPGESPPTGTEFEVRDALEAYRRLGKPDLLIYRKTAPPQVNLASADARERLRQYEMLDEFCRQVDERGEGVVWNRAYGEAFEFERLLTEHARRWIERQVGAAVSRPRWTHGSPYRGLQVFEAMHQEIYFGRSQAVSELTKRIREIETRSKDGAAVTRFLMVQGMSGNGKSSLIRAGLLPLLEGRAIEGIGLWRQVIFKPSDRSSNLPDAGVMGALAEALHHALPALAESYPDGQLAQRLRSAPGESAARLDGFLAQEAGRAELRPEQIRLALFVDQLEELFTSAFAKADCSAFAAILQALSLEGRIWVIATLRSDFAARLEEHPQLVNLITEGQVYLLGPPQPDELADMIREPATAAGLEWQTREGVSLDQAILRQATDSPESLPLLEYALDQLYERREAERRLTYAAYEALGRLKGGIAASAEAVVTAQDSSHQSFTRLMRALVSVDESGTAIRRYAFQREFPDGSPERALLDALIERRLCVTDLRGADAVVSLAHEALIHSWPRAVSWLKDEASLLQTRNLAEHETQVWEQHQRADAWLANAARLSAFEPLDTEHLTLSDPVRDFIRLSRDRVRGQRRLRRAGVAIVAVLAITASILALVASKQRNAAKVAETHAQIDAKTARATTDYLVGLFEEVDPAHSRGDKLLAREIVDRGFAKVDSELKDQPVVRAELLRTLGTVYDNLGLQATGEKALRESLRLAEQTPDVSALELARTRNALAFALVDSDKYEEAEQLYLKSIAYYDSRPQLRLEAITARGNLGYLYWQWGRCQEAQKWLTAARLNAVSIAGAQSKLASGMLFDLGRTKICLGDPVAGLDDMKQATEFVRVASGPNDVWYAADLYTVGFALRDLKRLAEAEGYFSKSVEILERVLGPDHPWLAIALYGYGSVVADQGRYSEGVPMLERSISIFKRAGTAASADELDSALGTLGATLASMEDYQHAIPVLKEAAEREEKMGGDRNQIHYAFSLALYGNALTRSGQPAEAIPLLRKGLAIVTQAAPNNPAALRNLRLSLAEGLCYTNPTSEGFALTTSVLAMTIPGETAWQRAVDKGLNAACDPSKLRIAANDDALNESVAILARERGPHSPQTRQMVQRLIRFYQSNGLAARAAIYQRQLATNYTIQPQQ